MNLAASGSATRRLSGVERRHQLLNTARRIVRDEGADRLTLGHLALRAGVSKPVVYDHFGSRSGLLIELYKSIDTEQVTALREALATGGRGLRDTVELLASAYIHCSAVTSREWHAVGAALAGSSENDAVYEELLEGYSRLFASALQPYYDLSPSELKRHCVGLIGAGDALSAAMIRGKCTEAEAARTFTALMYGQRQ